MEIKTKYEQEIDGNCAFNNMMSKYGKNGKIRICHVTEKSFHRSGGSFRILAWFQLRITLQKWTFSFRIHRNVGVYSNK